MDALVYAAEVFIELPEQHPSDFMEFVDALHKAQGLLAIRVVRRAHPGPAPLQSKRPLCPQTSPTATSS